MTIGGKSYPATLTTDYLRWTYNYTCRRDAQSRDFCYPSFERWSDDGRRADAVGCSDCVLGTFQTQLNSHFGFDDDLASEFESLTSACKATAYPLTQTTAHSEASTTSEAASRRVTQTTAPCKQPYVVKQQDDCHSISLSQNVSTSSLLSLNNLQAHCTNFPPPATRLCLPSECNTYTVQADDTCWDIIQSHKNAFTLSQLVSWNPDINRGCDNLPQLAGNQICVSFAGESPHARNGHTPFSLTTAAVPTNIAKDTVTCCRKYYEVTQSDTCASITQKHGVTLKTFFSLNPELKKACDNLMLGYSYCVRAVDDTHVIEGHGGSGDRHNPCSGGVDDRPSSCYATTYKTGPDWSWPTRPAALSRRARQTRRAVGASVSSLAMRVPATSLPSLVWVAMHTAKS